MFNLLYCLDLETLRLLLAEKGNEPLDGISRKIFVGSLARDTFRAEPFETGSGAGCSKTIQELFKDCLRIV
ncbi:hypothetical protein DSO57_1001138 [Entomophthora muscae]|uniref:Uncharacterized protein n=1 Tax=Entomophthora muscae TaxID=34485 RepID=A0ACC2S025_9FUNG|nr:hypothetical protein DSO57_1001138 [Entomophthora muscae]